MASRKQAKQSQPTWHARQGDVLIERVAGLPEGLTVVKRGARGVVLAEGEVTGHAHVVAEPRKGVATLYASPTDKGLKYLTIDELCEVQHEEHDTITLEPGVYKLPSQTQWSDEKEPRRVAD